MDWEQYVEFKRTVLTLPTAAERFTAIYRDNLWGNPESVSGTGSTIEHTARVRAALTELIRRFEIGVFLDVPCGDFNWMGHVVAENPALTYIGGEIVADLIARNQARFSSPRVRFCHLDLTSSALPKADVLMCRGCLHHLSYADTAATLKRFLEAEIPLLLTTTHVNVGEFSNHDIVTGDYRLINLFDPPYLFPQDVLWRTADCQPPVHETELCLWNRERVQAALATLESHLAGTGAFQ